MIIKTISTSQGALAFKVDKKKKTQIEILLQNPTQSLNALVPLLFLNVFELY